MNAASILVICIVVGLLIFSVTWSWKGKTDECGGNCAECIFRCKK